MQWLVLTYWGLRLRTSNILTFHFRAIDIFYWIRRSYFQHMFVLLYDCESTNIEHAQVRSSQFKF